MTSHWISKLEDRTSKYFVGRTQEIEFFTTLLVSTDPEYLITYIFGVGGVGKTTLLDRFASKARALKAFVGRINEGQRSVIDILEKFNQDIEKQEGKLEEFSRMYSSFVNMQVELKKDPGFAISLLENSGRVYSSQVFSSPSITAVGNTNGYNLGIVRELLTVSFDAEEITYFCYDTEVFRPVYEQLTHSMAKDEIIQRLIEFSERHALLGYLLDIAKNRNFEQYERYKPLLSNKVGVPYLSVAEDSFRFMELIDSKTTISQSRELLTNPDRALTGAFVTDICRLAHTHHVVLIFDTYEFVSSFGDYWLREEFLSRNLDTIASNITLIIAGREQLGSLWQPYFPIIKQFELKMFSFQEAEEFLLGQGVNDPTMIKKIQNLSGNLPLMLALLSVGTTTANDDLSIAQNLIERLLKWIPAQDSIKREVIITCAFPRFFDADVISYLLPDVDASEMFSWLCSFSFTNGHTGRWRYHPLVRQLMMQYRSGQSPKRYAELHRRLVEYYEALIAELEQKKSTKSDGVSIDSFTFQRIQQGVELERIYHKLCQNEGFEIFIKLFLQSFRQSAYAQELVNTFMEVQEDLQEKSRFYAWYALFQQVPQCRSALDCSLPDWLPLFERLSQYDGIDEPHLRAFVYYELGYFYAVQQQYAPAEDAYNQALALQPDYVSVSSSLGTLCLITGRVEEAEKLFRQCIEQAPIYVYPYYNLAHLLRRQGRDDEAEFIYRRAIEKRPKVSVSYFNLANFLRTIKRYQEANDAYHRAIELDSQYCNAYINLGLLLEEMGKNERAEAMYRQAQLIDSNNYLAHLNLGILKIKSLHPEEAMASFRRCIQIDEKRFDAYLQLASVLESLGREHEALSTYRQAILLAPNNSALKYLVAKLCASLGRYEEALRWFEEYAKLAPNDLTTIQLIDNLKARRERN